MESSFRRSAHAATILTQPEAFVLSHLIDVLLGWNFEATSKLESSFSKLASELSKRSSSFLLLFLFFLDDLYSS